MPNSISKTAKKINDQYFTPIDTAVWCLEQLVELGWTLEGVALEPCVGPGSFVKASEELGLSLEWRTNDLFPQPDYLPDTQLDASTLGLDYKPDFVVTNPPFGHTNFLAKKILAHSLNLCDRVAMILPKGARRLAFLDYPPLYAHLVLDSNLPSEKFKLSNGSLKTVNTCFQAWERKNNSRVLIKDTLDLRRNLVDFWFSDKTKSIESDFQVCGWGASMGKIRDEIKPSGAWLSVRVGPGFTVKEVQDVINSVDISDFASMSTSAQRFDAPVWLHRVNTEAVNRGLLPPVTN